jgi:hypothetical protein
MTKHEKWTEWPTEAYAAAYESLAAALDGFQNKFEVPETAREFVKQSAATAKDRSSDLHTGANKATDAVENALVSAALHRPLAPPHQTPRSPQSGVPRQVYFM